MSEQFGLKLGTRICDNCRKTLSKTRFPTEEQPSTPSPVSESSSSSPSPEFEQLEVLEKVSECLVSLGETPFGKRKASCSKMYAKQKVAEITSVIDRLMIGEEQPGDDTEIIQQLKKKFHRTSERSVKVQVLTILPMSWSIEKIQMEFRTSNFIARKAKQFVREHGILSTPDSCPGRSMLPKNVVDHVVSFYKNDTSSRIIPGKRTWYLSKLTMDECT